MAGWRYAWQVHARCGIFGRRAGWVSSIALAQYQAQLPDDFVVNLLTVRTLLAPTYTSLAVQKSPQQSAKFLASADQLHESPQSYTDYDWRLHWQLTIHSSNTFLHICEQCQAFV